MATQDMTAALGYFRGEYSLNWTLDCFSKPTVSLINGICMGSGAGLTLYNTHRVAGENYKFAMPEVAIGLFPDVGVSHVLANLKWPIGLYLGLTGRAIGWSDANWLGLATHCIPSQHYSWIIDKLSEAEPVDPLLDRLHEPQVIGPLQVESRWVEDTFTAGSIREIVGRLQRAQGASRIWAGTALASLSKASPLSLAITHRHICSARALDLRETLIEDYRIAVRCLNGGDFFEGVRAALIDKDGAPRWQHGTIDAVTDHEVAAYFEPLGPDDLVLPLRTQMQLLRV